MHYEPVGELRATIWKIHGEKRMVMVSIIATEIIPKKNNCAQDQGEMKEVTKNRYWIYFQGQAKKNLEDTNGCLWNKG